MIVYRVEIWCESCPAGTRKGTPHSDHTQLPGLGRNLEGIYLADGWTKDGQRHFCPKHSKKPKSAKKKPKSAKKKLARGAK